MSHTFISYSHKDEDITRRIVERLEMSGISVWIDYKSIPPGGDWEEYIEQGIKDCSALVLIQTPRSKDSKRVKKEWLFAEQLSKPIFPVLCEGDVWFSFVDVQYTDFRSDFDVSVKRLIQALPVHLEPDVISTATASQIVRIDQVFKHEGFINRAAFSNTGRYLGAVGGHGMVEVRNLEAKDETDKPTWLMTKFGYEAQSLAFSPDDRLLAVATRNIDDAGGLKFFDLHARREIRIARDTHYCSHVAFTPNGDQIIAAEGGLRPRIFVYDGHTLDLANVVEKDITGSVRDLAVSPDSDLIATSGRVPKGVYLWTLPDCEDSQILEFDNAAASIVAIDFTKDGKYLATGSAIGDIWLWDRNTGARDDTPISVGMPIKSIAFNPAGDLLAVSIDVSQDLTNLRKINLDLDDTNYGEVQFWSVAGKQQVTRLLKHRSTVTSLAFSPDGKQFATGGQDKRLHIWGIPTP